MVDCGRTRVGLSVGNFVDGVEYFSKRVVNDVIKLEVSTGVGIFIGFVHLFRKSDIESI